MRLLPPAEVARMRAVIANQLATCPAPDADGKIDIGAAGAWARAHGVVDAVGAPVYELLAAPEVGEAA